jgi:hypothetical protein
MRLVIAIEVDEDENYAAEVQLSDADLQLSSGAMSDKFCRQMLKKLLRGFESDDLADKKRSVHFFRERQRRVREAANGHG